MTKTGTEGEVAGFIEPSVPHVRQVLALDHERNRSDSRTYGVPPEVDMDAKGGFATVVVPVRLWEELGKPERLAVTLAEEVDE